MSFDSLSKVSRSPSSEANMGVCNTQVDPAEDSDDDIYTAPTDAGGHGDISESLKYKCGDIISRNDSVYSKWQEILVLSIIISVCLGVFMATFDSTYVGAWVLVYFADGLYLVDMFLMFFTSYKGKGGIQVFKRKKIIQKYLRNQFSVDLISVLPIEFFAFLFDSETFWMTVAFFRLNRLLRAYKIFSYFEKREDDLAQSTVITRGLKYFVISLLTTHVLTCGWYAVACDGHHDGVIRTCRNESWAKTMDLGFEMTEVESSKAYSTSLYWAVATATSTGYGDICASTIPEKWYSVFAMLAGIGVFFGMLLGGMTSLLANLDAHRSSYVHRFQTIQLSLKDQFVRQELRAMVVSYYEYLWRQKKGVVHHGIYDKLPLVFQAEIAQATNSETIQKAPIFQGVDTGLVRMLSLSFQHALYLPNQIIIKRGDIGSQMFFIHSGEVEVMHEDDDESAVATLKTGKIFGEVSLMFSLPRTATVRAKTHCDLMVLEKVDLQRILRHFPDAADKLQVEAKKRLTVINEISASKDSQDMKRPELSVNQPKWLRRASFMPSKPMLDDVGSVKSTALKLSDSVEIFEGDKVSADEEMTDQKPKGFLTFINKFCCELCPNAILVTSSTFYKVWQYLLMLTIILNSFIHPYMASFTAYERRAGYKDTTGGQILLTVTYLLDIIYIVDIVVGFRSRCPDSSSDLKAIGKSYVMGVRFWIDLLSVIPIEGFAFICNGSTAEKWRIFGLLRLNRLLKLYKVVSVFNELEMSLHVQISLVRSLRLILYIVLLSHWAACVMFIMACYGQECNSESWIFKRREVTSDEGPMTDYITSIYWAVATMTSTGYGDIKAHTTIGRVVALLLMLVGLLLYGYSLALMAATLANADTPRVRFQEKLFAVRDYMIEQRLNTDLQQQVITYMNLLWAKYRGIWLPGEEPLTHDVPQVLQEDISFDTVAESLENVPLFEGTDDNFLRSLSLKKTTYLFSPNDVIIYAGDVGREMYLIREGWCQVLTPDRSSVMGILGPGGFVGEVGLVYPENRSVTVVAKTHCVLEMIDIDDLHDTLTDFQLLREQFDLAEKDKSVLMELQKNHTSQLVKQMRSISGSNSSVTGTNSSKVSIKSFKKTAAGNVPNKDYLAPFKDLNIFTRIFANMLMRRTFHPEGRFLKTWTALMVVVSVVISFTVTLQASFLHDSYLMWIVSYFLDSITLISLYLSFHISFFNKKNILVTHPLSTANHYLRTNFLLDFLSVFPFEIFAFAAHPHLNYQGLYLFSMVRLTKLIQLYRLPMTFTYFESSIEKETGLLREIKFGFYIVIFLNWLTCAFFVMACPPNLSDTFVDFITLPKSGHQCLSNSWLLRNAEERANASTSSLYTACLYWATATSVSVGYGDISAFKNEEMVISLIAMVAGVLFFGYIIASVAASLANADAQRARFQEKLSAITHFLQNEKLEQGLQKRIFHYYDYVWLRTRGVDPNSLFNFLPLAIWGDVTLDLYEQTLQGISLFKDAETSFLKMLSRTIRPILFLKGEYVVRKFDMGQEMYFIKRGSVEVVSEDGAVVFATMRAGDSFGEVALLFSVPRTASIRAGTNADLFYLTKSDLDHVLNLYPKVKETVLQIGEERRQQARQRSVAKAQAAKKSKSAVKLGSRPSVVPSKASQKSKLLLEPSEDGVLVKSSIQLVSSDAVGFVPSVIVGGEEYPIPEGEEYEEPSDPVEVLHEEEWEAAVSDEDLDDELPDDDYNTNTSNNTRAYPQGQGGGSLQNSNQNNVKGQNKNQSNKDDGSNAGETEKPEGCLLLKRFLDLNRFSINPRSRALHAFNSLMCFLGFISVWCITYQAAYQDKSVALIAIGFIFDIFFFADIYIRFHTSFFDEYGDITENFEEVYKNYLKSPNGFLVDMIAAFPLDIFAFAAPSGKKLAVLFFLRLIHCVRLLRVNSYFAKWEKGLNINMLAARLTKFFVGLVLLIHFLSCIWYSIACPMAECKPLSWVQLKVNIVNSSLNSYCVCVYWTVATMTSTGYGDVYAKTDIEMLFASVVMVAGKLMFGFILGNIASTLSNAEIPKVQYQEKLGVLEMAMRDQSVPPKVKKMVIDYMVNLWFHNKAIEPHSLFTDTPPCLVAELFRKISSHMFDTMAILKGSDESFLRALSIRVKQHVFIPGNYIMRKGDVGQEAYFIHKGEVQVWMDSEPLQVLKAGEVFGEVSLLAPVTRQVDVSARTHVVLMVLSLNDLDEVLMDFPTIAEHVHHVGYERFKDVLRPDYAKHKHYFNKEDKD